MGYRIPSKQRLSDAISRVLASAGTVRSQSHLAELVSTELEKDDAGFRVSGDRIRRIAVEMPKVRVAITTRRSKGTQPAPTACPVCGAAMKTRRNQTLDGRVAEVDRRCGRCPYWTGADRRVPTCYTFHYRDWRTLTTAHG